MAFNTKEKLYAYKKRWRAANLEHALAMERALAKKHRERINMRNRERYAADAEAYRLYKRRWHQANAERIAIRKRQKCRERKLEVIAAYGGKCVCCGESRWEFLTIDHIFKDGWKQRKEEGVAGEFLYVKLKQQGWPKDRYRLLCLNCNFSHGKYGYCPHEKEAENAGS